MLYFLLFIFVVPIFSQESCTLENLVTSRSIYSVGEALSDEDQNISFPVCNGSGDYETGESFSFADFNGDLNGGDYKITIISMNATW